MDDHCWPGLHHAVDATSFSWRALEATKGLRIEHYTSLGHRQSHIWLSAKLSTSWLSAKRCAGRDATFARADIVNSMVRRRANLDVQTQTGNTPFLLACATGVTDVMQTLVECRADATALNARRRASSAARGMMPRRK